MRAGNPSCPRSGFSLIEMLVVMVLLAVVAAAILPEMRGTYEDTLLRSTARELVGVLDLASSRAVTLRTAHRVRIDAANHRYRIESVGRAIEEKRPASSRPVSARDGTLDSRISVRIRPARVESDGPPRPDNPSAAEDGPGRGVADAVSFYADGTADDVELLFESRDGTRLVLRVNPVTSRVRTVPAQDP